MPRRMDCWQIKGQSPRFCCAISRGMQRHDCDPANRPRVAMSEAEIRWVGGPVLYARIKGEFRVAEAIEVGRDRRPGEVIRLKGDELVGQVYEDITGARPGDPVYGTGGALSIRLGPGLLGGIFDGLLRPLDIELASETSAPNGDVALAFRPSVATGDVLPPGTAFGMLPD